ncbi:MAG: protein-L-isoaspartate O-methyltransferase [Pseudomonadota bacterium]
MDYAAAREAMVDTQVRPSDVTRYGIIEAMSLVPRELFVPGAKREIAYAETEVPLNDTRAMATPRTLAKMLEAARIGAEDLVLDVAPGTGYGTVLMARLAEAVVAIEPDPALASAAQSALDTLEVVNATVSVGDAAAGDPAHGPFDVIMIAGAIEALPDGLVKQLKDGGRLVAIFRDGPLGKCRVLTRAGDAVSEKWAFDADAPLLPGFEKTRQFEF